MKRYLLLLLALPFTVHAQKQKKQKKESEAPPPRVWVGNVRSYNTTREQILTNPKLVTDSAGCRVSGFTISLQAPGQPFYGPLWAVGEDMTQTQKDVIRQWDYPNVTVFIQDIHLNCHEKDATSPAFQLHYDH